MVDLATLVVKLEAQTAAFTEGLRGAEEKVTHLTEVVGEQVNKITERFLEFEALKKAFEFTDKIVEDVARISELSAALGISADKLSELQYAAQLHGVDDVVQPLQRMARAAGQAEEGNIKLIAAFNQLGIGIKDLRSLSPDQLFVRIAEATSHYADGLGKTATVQQIFGRNSAQFIATLNQGKEGLSEASEEAKIFGVSIGTGAAEAVRELHEQILRLEAAFSGVFKQALIEVEPLLSKAADSLVDFVKNSGGVHVVAAGIAEGFSKIVSVGSELVESLKPLGTVIFAVFEQLGKANLEVFEATVAAVLPVLKDLISAATAIITPILELAGSVAVGLLHAFTAVIETIGPGLKALSELVKELAIQVGAFLEGITKGFQDLADKDGIVQSFADTTVVAFQIIATAAATVITTFEVVGKSIAGVVAEYDIFNQLPSKTDWLLHPIESAQKFKQLSEEGRQVAQDTLDDINSSFDKGDKALGQIWGDATDSVTKYASAVDTALEKDFGITEPDKGFDDKKPQLQPPDLKGYEEAKKAIDELIKEQQKLDQEVNTFGLGSAAATIYNVQFGKLSEAVAKLGNESKEQQRQFLALAQAEHAITPDVFDKLSVALKNGINIGEMYKKSIIDTALAFEALKNTDAIQKLDEQILTFAGHAREAAAAAFQVTNRSLDASLQQQVAQNYLSQFDGAQKVAIAQSRINELQKQAVGIQQNLSTRTSEVTAAMADGSQTAFKGEEQLASIRAFSIGQLEELHSKVSALAVVSGDKALQKQAEDLAQSIAATQNKVGLETLNTQKLAIDYQAQYNELQLKATEINSELAEQLAKINDLQAHGSITTLDAAQKEDEARKNTIAQLTEIQQRMQAIADITGSPQIVDGTKKLGTGIVQLHSQVDQLAKTLREDFVNDANTAFSDFALGTKKAGDAAREFLQSLESELIRLINKKLFEQIFSTGSGSAGGGGSGLGGIFNLLAGAITGISGAGGFSAADASALDATASQTVTDFSAGFNVAAVTPRAKGGPINSGEEYIVGEEGVEVFVPDDGTGSQMVGTAGPQYLEAEKPGKILPHEAVAGLLSKEAAQSSQPLEASSGLRLLHQFSAAGTFGDFTEAGSLVSQQEAVVQVSEPKKQASLFDRLAAEIRVPESSAVDASSIAGVTSEHDAISRLERRAGGGGVNEGQPYIVGEQGPELMVPASSGTIVPTNELRKQALTVNNTFHIAAPQGTVSRATQSQVAAATARAVQIAAHRNN